MANSMYDVRELIAKREAIKKQIRDELIARKETGGQGYYGPPTKKPFYGQVPVVAAPGSTAAVAMPQKKAGLGLALAIVGGAIFVFWGIPLIQGKGGFKPGMSKPPGYVPTRMSPSIGE